MRNNLGQQNGDLRVEAPEHVDNALHLPDGDALVVPGGVVEDIIAAQVHQNDVGKLAGRLQAGKPLVEVSRAARGYPAAADDLIGMPAIVPVMILVEHQRIGGAVGQDVMAAHEIDVPITRRLQLGPQVMPVVVKACGPLSDRVAQRHDSRRVGRSATAGPEAPDRAGRRTLGVLLVDPPVVGRVHLQGPRLKGNLHLAAPEGAGTDRAKVHIVRRGPVAGGPAQIGVQRDVGRSVSRLRIAGRGRRDRSLIHDRLDSGFRQSLVVNADFVEGPQPSAGPALTPIADQNGQAVAAELTRRNGDRVGIREVAVHVDFHRDAGGIDAGQVNPLVGGQRGIIHRTFDAGPVRRDIQRPRLRDPIPRVLDIERPGSGLAHLGNDPPIRAAAALEPDPGHQCHRTGDLEVRPVSDIDLVAAAPAEGHRPAGSTVPIRTRADISGNGSVIPVPARVGGIAVQRPVAHQIGRNLPAGQSCQQAQNAQISTHVSLLPLDQMPAGHKQRGPYG